MNKEDIIKEFFEKADIPVEGLTVNVLEEGIVEIKIKTEDPKILIGEKGKTLNEIQKLLAKVLNKKTEERNYINLDVNDYKKRKREQLKSLAKEIADEVSFMGKEKVLPYMSSFERKIVHTELQNHPSVITESKGEGRDRRLVIKPS